jgi:hypothetical protein
MMKRHWKARITLRCNVCGLDIGSAESDYGDLTPLQDELVLQDIRQQHRVGAFRFPHGVVQDICRPCLEHLSHWLLGAEPPEVIPEADGDQEVPY